MPKISVIIPIYNSARYLEDCLLSLAAQSEGDFEALLIDDGSGDGSPALMRKWQARDSRFRAIFRPHGGVSAARNVGIREARGTYLFFLDADDLLPPDAFAKLLDAAGEAEITCAWHEEFDPDGRTRRYAPDLPPLPTGPVLRRIIEGDSVYNITCNKLYRRSYFEAQGLSYPQGLRIGEDALVNFRAFLGASRVALVRSVTYCYRIHPASAMRGRQGEYDRHLPYYLALYDLLGEKGILPRFAGSLAAALALRYYKQHGFGGLLRGLGGALRAFPSLPGPWGWLQRTGLYPCYYACTFPARRLRWAYRARKRRA